jgi:hypothetical protein
MLVPPTERVRQRATMTVTSAWVATCSDTLPRRKREMASVIPWIDGRPTRMNGHDADDRELGAELLGQLDRGVQRSVGGLTSVIFDEDVLHGDAHPSMDRDRPRDELSSSIASASVQVNCAWSPSHEPSDPVSRRPLLQVARQLPANAAAQ